MASVKISDLPSASVAKAGDVMIVNSTSDNTTKKIAVSTFFQNGTSYSHTVTFTPINGLTVVDSSNNPVDITAKFMFTTPYAAFVFLSVPAGARIVNTANEAKQVQFAVSSPAGCRVEGVLFANETLNHDVGNMWTFFQGESGTTSSLAYIDGKQSHVMTIAANSELAFPNFTIGYRNMVHVLTPSSFT